MPTLTWLNDDEARKLSGRIPYRLLEYDSALSSPLPAGDREASRSVAEGGQGGEVENMLIQGDNLEALKALLSRLLCGEVRVKPEKWEE